ncbi:MAG: hypothetical protein IJU76_14695 [Desulfovibrionaceae bacterium]|nr:hypothetical protein [Desulfovibrionaceae bacterium]
MSLTVCLCKTDLDTLVTAVLLFPELPYDIRSVSSRAPEAYLADPSVVCIECGGSGRVQENNFDHHDGCRVLPCAAEQAWDVLGRPQKFAELVRYTAALDLGEGSLGAYAAPSLSACVSGMLLSVRAETERFSEGFRIVSALMRADISPWDIQALLDMEPRWMQYMEAKEASRRALLTANVSVLLKEPYVLMTTVTAQPGVHGLLRSRGADVALAGNGSRWTISFGLRVPAYYVPQVVNALIELEEGWGGPVGGRIIGSPRGVASRLSLEDIANVLVRLFSRT